jgi:hypothetical protein
MKQTARQWSNEDMQKIAEAYEECTRIVESLGKHRKNKNTKSKQEKKG